MAIDYKKVGWDTTKFVNPTNMNQMDNGIKAACDGVDALNAEMDAVNEDLSKKNIKTYFGISQIGKSSDNTILEIMAALPTNTMVIAQIAADDSAALNNSLPNKGRGQLTLTKSTVSTRGRVKFESYDDNSTYHCNFIDGKLGTWDAYSDCRHITNSATLNSKLSSTYTKVVRSGKVVTVTLRCDSELSASENLITGLPNPLTHLLGIPLINSSTCAVDALMHMYTSTSGAILQNAVAKSAAARVTTFTYITNE